MINLYHATLKQEGNRLSRIKPVWDVAKFGPKDTKIHRAELETKTKGGATQGFFDEAKKHDWKIHTGPAWQATPSGEFKLAQFKKIKQELLNHLKETIKELRTTNKDKNMDVVFLDLHGSMVVKGVIDIEDDITKAVRKIVGTKCFIIAAYDQQATKQLKSLHNNMMTFYQTNPHTDLEKTGKTCAELAKMHLGGVSLFQTATKLGKVAIPNIGLETERDKPLGKLLHKKIFTTKNAKRSFVQMVKSDPRLITWGIATDHPYTLRIKSLGPLITIIGKGETAQKKAEKLTRQLAKEWLRQLGDFVDKTPEIEEIVTAIKNQTIYKRKDFRQWNNYNPNGRILITETPNNPGAGGGKETYILSRLIELGLNVDYGPFSNPKLARQISKHYQKTLLKQKNKKPVRLKITLISDSKPYRQIAGTWIIEQIIVPNEINFKKLSKNNPPTGWIMDKKRDVWKIDPHNPPKGYFWDYFNKTWQQKGIIATLRLINLQRDSGIKWDPKQEVRVIVAQGRIQPGYEFLKMAGANPNRKSNNNKPSVTCIGARAHPFKDSALQKATRGGIQAGGSLGGVTHHNLPKLHKETFVKQAEKLGVTVVGREVEKRKYTIKTKTFKFT